MGSSRVGGPAAHEQVDLRIQSVVHGGEGLGRLPSGEVVLVPLAAPGELLRVRLDRGRKPARGRVLAVVEPGVGRVEPICAVFGRCGGCDLMHLGDATRADIALALAREALRGGPEPTYHVAEQPLGYRQRARLSLRRGALGQRARSSRDVVPTELCAVLAPPLEAARRALERALPRTTAEVHLGVSGAGVVCGLEADELEAAGPAALDSLVQSGVVVGARVVLAGARAPMDFGDPRQRFDGADGRPLLVPPLGFAQPSAWGGAVLSRLTRVLALARKPERVLELFSGSGTLSISLAGDTRLECIESDEPAVRCARENLAARSLSARVAVGDAEATPIPGWARTVVLDPPRTGARGVAAALARSRAEVVVYVSCDAPTFARDARVLEGAGFRVDAAHVVELFPQTSHFELVVRLSR